MGVYRVEWTEELWRSVELEAVSVEHAMAKFDAGEFDVESVRTTGQELQDSVEIVEVD